MNQDNQNLLDHCVEYATDLLNETGEAYPFGGFIDSVGQVHPMEMEIDNKNVPNIGKVVQTLSKFGNEELSHDRIRAYAVTYEVKVDISEDETQDCIAIDIKNPEEELPVFYLPFQKREEEMLIGELFAVAR
ncbi:hypothetical protein K6119_19255 [Paracrocinitomix mangrovi]|uniref:hypothetical protein n=1 Tax=Paracrocinitomix mangrovi TaxID=2862509 RepID=UPI001C8EAB27|nr:hypothetical protein [Paracrocinitomix mangrovi]UKN01864.1 hypothetical protein K6119_19255 [Paracrocinitomix mangrovi]